MQVLCKMTTETAGDVQCSVCGQGFMVYSVRQTDADKDAARELVLKALADQHGKSTAPTVHPQTGFNVPEWDGPVKFSAAALLGGAPKWAC